MLWVLLSIIIIFLIVVLIGILISGQRYHGPTTAHFDGRKFKNPSGASAHGFMEVIKWMMNRNQGPWKKVIKTASAINPADTASSTRITYINHSTFLIQTEGMNFLTDPVYSERVSPFTWIGPKRMGPPGIPFDDLPKIDYVLISHNHYDHLDKSTVLRLHERFKPVFITPLGVDLFLQGIGIEKVVTLDWWQEIQLHPPVSVVAVPAQHFSGRGFLDRDATLWCGYGLKTAGGNIYFAGDSGYDQQIFKEIGEALTPIKLSLIPIGAYLPIWFMAPVHISPDQAVRAHRDLNSQQSVATHFGTFPLGDDGQMQPPEDLKRALKEQKIPEEAFWVLKPGEVRVVK